jgi:hypothetical protein
MPALALYFTLLVHKSLLALVPRYLHMCLLSMLPYNNMLNVNKIINNMLGYLWCTLLPLTIQTPACSEGSSVLDNDTLLQVYWPETLLNHGGLKVCRV